MPDSDLEADAYQAYCENKYGWIFMPRDNFESLASMGAGYFELDLTQTPLVNLTKSPQFIAAVAQQLSSDAYEVEIYRYDPKDAQSSGQVNEEIYLVALGGQPTAQLLEIAGGIPSTDFDDNLVEFSQRHVTLWRLPSSQVPDHHSSQLPSHVWGLIKST